jgi:voltage-gated potassium channel
MSLRKLKKHVRKVIFETDTHAGVVFDEILLILILCSVALVMFESIESYALIYYDFFAYGERIITAIFSVEYLFRLWSAKKRSKYATSFYGLVDLAAILPAYIDFFFAISGAGAFAIIRALRLLRIFRIFKLNSYISESNVLIKALQTSGRKIFVFLITVVIIVVLAGTGMYVIEGADS